MSSTGNQPKSGTVEVQKYHGGGILSASPTSPMSPSRWQQSILTPWRQKQKPSCSSCCAASAVASHPMRLSLKIGYGENDPFSPTIQWLKLGFAYNFRPISPEIGFFKKKTDHKSHLLQLCLRVSLIAFSTAICCFFLTSQVMDCNNHRDRKDRLITVNS